MTETNTTETGATCSNIIERRSGYSMTTGHGDRAGAFSALCGKPVADGETYCTRCRKTITRRNEQAHQRNHDNLRRSAIGTGREVNFETDCHLCNAEKEETMTIETTTIETHDDHQSEIVLGDHGACTVETGRDNLGNETRHITCARHGYIAHVLARQAAFTIEAHYGCRPSAPEVVEALDSGQPHLHPETGQPHLPGECDFLDCTFADLKGEYVAAHLPVAKLTGLGSAQKSVVGVRFEDTDDPIAHRAVVLHGSTLYIFDLAGAWDILSNAVDIVRGWDQSDPEVGATERLWSRFTALPQVGPRTSLYAFSPNHPEAAETVEVAAEAPVAGCFGCEQAELYKGLLGDSSPISCAHHDVALQARQDAARKGHNTRRGYEGGSWPMTEADLPPETNLDGDTFGECASPACSHSGYYSDARRNLCPACWAETSERIAR